MSASQPAQMRRGPCRYTSMHPCIYGSHVYGVQNVQLQLLLLVYPDTVGFEVPADHDGLREPRLCLCNKWWYVSFWHHHEVCCASLHRHLVLCPCASANHTPLICCLQQCHCCNFATLNSGTNTCRPRLCCPSSYRNSSRHCRSSLHSVALVASISARGLEDLHHRIAYSAVPSY